MGNWWCSHGNMATTNHHSHKRSSSSSSSLGDRNTHYYPSTTSTSKRLKVDEKSVLDIDGYTIVSRLGTGAFGSVFKAFVTDSDPTQWVALKISEDDQHNGVCRDGLREIAILSRLAPVHGVVGLHDYLRVNQALVAVLDYYPHNLMQYVSLHPGCSTDMGWIRRTFKQLADTLCKCHERGVWHRDLKPENILVSDDGTRVVIADWGMGLMTLQHHEVHLPRCHPIVTAPYRPPELWMECQSYNERVDVWSLAVTWLMVLRGGRPIFLGRDDQDTLRRIVCRIGWDNLDSAAQDKLSARLPDIPWKSLPRFRLWCGQSQHRPLWDLIMAMLRWNPETRISASQVCKHAFFNNGTD